MQENGGGDWTLEKCFKVVQESSCYVNDISRDNNQYWWQCGKEKARKIARFRKMQRLHAQIKWAFVSCPRCRALFYDVKKLVWCVSGIAFRVAEVSQPSAIIAVRFRTVKSGLGWIVDRHVQQQGRRSGIRPAIQIPQGRSISDSRKLLDDLPNHPTLLASRGDLSVFPEIIEFRRQNLILDVGSSLSDQIRWDSLPKNAGWLFG